MGTVVVGIVGISALLVMILLGIHIGTSMLVTGFLGFSYLVSTKAAYYMSVTGYFSTFSSYNLTVIPLFIFMGQVLFKAGTGERLYILAYNWLGRLPGGLAIATIGGCAGFAGISGSAIATAATFGSVALPEMRKYNYDESLATGTIAAGGTLGVLIPPSVTLIIYGILAQESIGKLFLAGIVPGLLLGALFMVTVYFLVKRNPRLGPPATEKISLRAKMASLVLVWETLILFLIVMGGLFSGLFTPTEAAGIGACGAIGVTFFRRQLSWRLLFQSFFETLRTSCMVMVIIAGATVFNSFLAVTKVPFELAGWILAMDISPTAVMLVICLMFIIGGFFMEALPLILLTVPIFLPVVTLLGYDTIWFGIIIVLLGQIGMITPPVGVNVFVISGISNVPTHLVFKGVLPFVITMMVCIIILMIFPQIVMFLPNL